MVKDKETKMKESLKIMGLKSWIYALGMLTQRSIYMLIPTFIVTLFMLIYCGDVYSYGTLAILSVQMLLYGIGLCSFSMFLADFFADFKLVTMVLPFLLYIPTGLSLVSILNPLINQQINTWMKFLFFFPSFPFTTLCVNLLDKTGVEYYDVSDGVAWFFLVIQGPLYFFLHLYAEAVLPNNYGVKRNLCFCFDKYKKNQVQKSSD